MPQASPEPPKKSKRRSSATRFLKQAAAAGLSIRSIEFDPITGKCTMMVREPAPAKAPVEAPAKDADDNDNDADLDRELTEWEGRRGR